jgi:hypothetical protein
MAELLILDFEGLDEADYRRVNGELGIDPDTGDGEWPAGLISHAAGVSDAGRAYVVEVWESQQHQADFMNTRLGPALGGAGVSAVPDVTWAHVVGHQNPGL